MRLLAKEIVASRRTVARLYENQAQMNSVSMMLTEQLATVRSVGHLEKSTEVLAAMNGLVRNADVRDSMREMSKEMAKSGLIEELVNDALEDINGVDDLEAETDAEVNKILAEIAGETAVTMPGAERARVAPKAVAAEPEPSLRAETQREAPVDDLQARLDAIRAMEEAS
jgi:charged multivesicular body protein 3